MGSILARELQKAGTPFVVVDHDLPRLQQIEALGILTIHGDATDENVLQQAGISLGSVVATVLSDDATNVFVSITARAMNPNVKIIARGENPQTERKLLGCGANRVVLPTAIGATKVAHLINRPAAEAVLEELTGSSDMNEELGQIGLRFHELEVTDRSPLANKSLSRLEVHSNHGFLIVGIRNIDQETVLNPPSDTPLSVGDVVIVLGHSDDIPLLAEKFFVGPTRITYRGVTVEQ
jgi:voltage-gated potassium channel